MFNYDKLQEEIEKSGKTKTYLCSKLGRPKYYLRDVLRQKNAIPAEYQKILADELNVSVAYLNDEINEDNKKAASVFGNNFSLDEVEFLKNVDLLNPDLQRLLLAVSKFESDQLCRFADLAESFVKNKNNF